MGMKSKRTGSPTRVKSEGRPPRLALVNSSLRWADSKDLMKSGWLGFYLFCKDRFET